MAWLFQGFAVRGALTDHCFGSGGLQPSFHREFDRNVRKAAGHLEDNLTFLKQIGTVFQ
jgi:hypothetical protein